MRISVVGPAFNEGKNLPLFVEKVNHALKNLDIEGEVLIIDDASTDNTFSIAETLSSKYNNVRVLRNRKNRGLTGTAWRGFLSAKEDVIVLFPTDMESDPETDLPKLLTKFNEGYDMVVGWRYNKKQGFVKGLISRSFNFTAHMLFGVSLHDLGWIKIFRREVIDEIPPLRSDWHRLFPIIVSNYGYSVGEVKTEFISRKFGKSSFGRFGFARIPGAFFDMLSLKFQLSFSKRPMRIFGSGGLLMTTIGFLIGLYVIYLNFTQAQIANRTPLILLVVVFIIAGIQIFAIGFLAEHLALIESELQRKE